MLAACGVCQQLSMQNKRASYIPPAHENLQSQHRTQTPPHAVFPRSKKETHQRVVAAGERDYGLSTAAGAMPPFKTAIWRLLRFPQEAQGARRSRTVPPTTSLKEQAAVAQEIPQSANRRTTTSTGEVPLRRRTPDQPYPSWLPTCAR